MWRTLQFALVLGAIPAPAEADVIVQTSSNGHLIIEGALQGFDHSLGTLISVSLDVELTENRLGWGHVGIWPEGLQNSVIGWTISDVSTFVLRLAIGTPPPEIATLAIPIYGTGQEVIDSQDRGVPMSATGTGHFSIDPTLIPTLGSRNPFYDMYVQFVGPGFYDHSGSYFVAGDGLNPQGLGGQCGNGSFSHNCIQSTYTLTYTYTPFGAVPEPETWAMMLLGFGAIGFAMRRQRRCAMHSNPC